jgi:RNA polymerase sigma-70 factor, ECF subfamily
MQRFDAARLYLYMVLDQCLSLTDDEVVERVKGGEIGLYELLMRRYNQRLFRIIRSVVIDSTEAEDVLQDAWVRAYEHLEQFAGRSSFATWVTKIAYYEALARSRRAKRTLALQDEEGEIMPEARQKIPAAETPEEYAIRGELQTALRSAIDGLPEMYRSVFMLREVEQLSTAETADCLGLSEEAVKTRLHRSRALLRHDLEARAGRAIAASFAFMGDRCDRTVAAVMARIQRDPSK